MSFGLPGRAQAGLISGGNPSDRFVLALLRACADAIVVGAGTLRQERDHVWTPEHVFPDAAADFAALRHALGKPAQPRTVFVSRSGAVPRDAPAIRRGALVLSGDRVATARAIRDAVVAETGARLVLSEGGPHVIGAFLRERLLDELFLTLAPQIAGRSDDERRLGLVEGVAFAPEDAPWAGLVSVKRARDFLFLRFGFG